MNRFFEQLKCGNPKKLTEQVKSSERSFSTLGDDCRSDECVNKAACWRFHIIDCAWMIYRWHFGFRGKLPPQKIVTKGVEMGLTYFDVVRDPLAKARAGMRWDKEVKWFEPYSLAVLMASLGGCMEERQRLSNFLHPKLVVEMVAIPTEPALGDVLLCIAASFQSKPMATAPLVERLKKCRKQRPKLLFKAWQALEDGDRAKFVSALADSTANFGKTTAEDDVPLTAVAVQESILAALAYERGWTDLEFELPIAARLVTHQSLELK